MIKECKFCFEQEKHGHIKLLPHAGMELVCSKNMVGYKFDIECFLKQKIKKSHKNYNQIKNIAFEKINNFVIEFRNKFITFESLQKKYNQIINEVLCQK